VSLKAPNILALDLDSSKAYKQILIKKIIKYQKELQSLECTHLDLELYHARRISKPLTIPLFPLELLKLHFGHQKPSFQRRKKWQESP
jgi:hypothetical protein